MIKDHQPDDIFLDTKGIARACKIPIEQINCYVEKYGLPAWKESQAHSAPWKARPETLQRWAIEHERKKIGHHPLITKTRPKINR